MKLRCAVLLAWIIGAALPVEARSQYTAAVADLPDLPGASNLSSTCWVRGEYLLWWLKDQALPPLVTTSATQASVGRIGFGDTSVLYGGDVDGKVRQGFRITAGAAPGRCWTIAYSWAWKARSSRWNLTTTTLLLPPPASRSWPGPSWTC